MRKAESDRIGGRSGSGLSAVKRLIHGFLVSQWRISYAIDNRLPLRFRRDGMEECHKRIIPRYLLSGTTIYDVGGGQSPYIDAETKRVNGYRYIGLDIDGEQLRQAPPGTYDNSICADITRYRGQGDGDMVIAKAVFEHVPNTASALASIASILKPGGRAVVFAPSRYALYGRFNRWLPEEATRTLLELARGERVGTEGFRAYYDRCSPEEFVEMGRLHGLRAIEVHRFYASAYFHHFVPAYLVWRLWQLLVYICSPRRAIETFVVVFEKERAENTSRDAG